MPATRIWCDYCNAEITVRGVLSCVRESCESKEKAKTFTRPRNVQTKPGKP